MGAGKSTVAPRVAKRLQFESIDLDQEITTRLGMSVPAIFDVLGESVFREEEKRCLEEASLRSQIVVSLGGGTLTDHENLSLCLETGFLVYLKGSASFLASRLSHSRQTRPLLFGSKGDMLEGRELEARIQHLLNEREMVYEKAHQSIEINDVAATDVVRQVLETIKRRG